MRKGLTLIELLMIIVIIVILAVLLAGSFGFLNQKDIQITVDRREKTKDQYLIWSISEGVLTVKDSIWFWRFNSSDTYGELKEGHTYNVHVAGWRIPFLSMYKNIIRINREVVQEENSKATNFCPWCGKAVQQNDNFCKECGHKLD